jgi:hypothetical protein
VTRLLAKRDVDVYSPSRPPRRGGDKAGNIRRLSFQLMLF